MEPVFTKADVDRVADEAKRVIRQLQGQREQALNMAADLGAALERAQEEITQLRAQLASPAEPTTH